MGREIDADADGQPAGRLAALARGFQQDAGDLATVRQNVVRPFHANLRMRRKSASMSHAAIAATNESCAHSLAGLPGRSISVAAQISGWRLPAAASAATASGLPRRARSRSGPPRPPQQDGALLRSWNR